MSAFECIFTISYNRTNIKTARPVVRILLNSLDFWSSKTITSILLLSVVLLKPIQAITFRTKFLLVCSICVPPNNPITACGATSFPGYHSFPKWAIETTHFSILHYTPRTKSLCPVACVAGGIRVSSPILSRLRRSRSQKLSRAKSRQLRRLCAQPQMSCILTYVRVALPTSDVQSILEIPATDEIQLEDRNQTYVSTATLVPTG